MDLTLLNHINNEDRKKLIEDIENIKSGIVICKCCYSRNLGPNQLLNPELYEKEYKTLTRFRLNI